MTVESLESINADFVGVSSVGPKQEGPLHRVANNFWKERLEVAERFIWLTGIIGSSAALTWVTGALINKINHLK